MQQNKDSFKTLISRVRQISMTFPGFPGFFCKSPWLFQTKSISMTFPWLPGFPWPISTLYWLRGRGGTMWFSFFAYSNFTPLPHAGQRAKPCNYSLLMVLRIIFLDSKNKILKIGCRNREFPKIQKIFFFENVKTQNAKTSPVLNIFRQDRS